MFSQTLVKLIDEAIIPAIVVIISKVLGVVFLSYYLNLDWEISKGRISYSSPEAFLAVNSYSNLIMFGVIFLGLIWVLMRAHIFHDTHIPPALAAKLFTLNLPFLIGATIEVFHQAVIWVSYAWFTTFLVLIQTYFGLAYPWVAILALVISLNSTWLLVLDVEREITISKQQQGEEEYITQGAD